MKDIGIVGYGSYIPKYRIKVEEIAKVWGKDPEAIKKGLVVNEKSVPSPDEDTATIAVEAARNAVKRAGINAEKIGAVYVGSESHPYAVKPTSATVAEAIGATPDLTAADLEFACKAGTAGIQMCMGLVGSGLIEYGMAIGADTAQGAPGDALEYTASAGGAAYIIGNKKDEMIAVFNGTYSYTTDTPDFWRREGQSYPKHGGRFTGEPAYFKHVLNAAKGIMEKMGTTVKDYDYCVFHQPNGKFYIKAAKSLGFTNEQYKYGLLTPYLGNTYSGAVPLGLSNILDHAEEGARILAVSYGSGAGSDAFDITVTERIKEVVDKAPKTLDLLNRKKYIDYAVYVKYRGKIKI
ncbi:MAG: hydroxymethylglutaryl-CoA synthase [Methanothermococcus sp.]|uniref:Hydroxymethylglutaryl-CoA synthase n=1 Tax=Methanothermococcus thermolithotrophicus TaxID=2186 RepID=HMGCS_METTL|nr:MULTISPECIES: hydroxymethylglutaryl-CoA synthase [Methanothermococcus]6ESQ_I Chain I, HydroxyMethylGlutaryl-CoA synthase [Methanothermococcus thermolithotrophicus]6ESQ_J Chain J, HydroxyMethylGlutaryl-CoA synthase [Methanothermococcus thermolithotrophicus]6ESQ_K Chain K, HydroxyMethylGlutaryl-CoA synthase [Methanothermococcus thermolithotrophicus]6ESQ_L Chain L, HydroxyMethylGlutaryl-CoA synthase [Methanothermococcus thermolithotrophicus]6ET9_I Chain I, HydroxyMethylGlutaryl-CoA synthase [M